MPVSHGDFRVRFVRIELLDISEPLLIQFEKGTQTSESVSFEHAVIKADKNVYPPLNSYLRK